MKKTTLGTLIAAKTEPAPKNNFKLVAASDNEPVELFVYGDIGWWGMDGTDIKSLLLAYHERDLVLYFNTLGGDVEEGFMMYDLIKAHKGKVTGIVDGKCYSIGVPILTACDEIYMRPNAMLMIHEPWGGTYGSIADNEAWIEQAKMYRQKYADVLAEHTNKSAEEILKDMEQDHYLTTNEAIDYGLCDHVITTATLEASAKPYRTLRASLEASGQSDSNSELIKTLKAQVEESEPVSVSESEPDEPTASSESDSSEPNDNEPTLSASQTPNSAIINSKETGEEMPKPLTPEEVAALQAAEKERKDALIAAATPFMANKNVKELLEKAKDDPTMTVAQFQSQLLAHIGGQQEQTPVINACENKTNQDHLRNFIHAKLNAAEMDKDNPYAICESTVSALRAHMRAEGVENVPTSNTKLIARAYDNDHTNLGDLFESAMQIILDNEMAKATNWHQTLVERRPMKLGQATKILKMTDVVAPTKKTEHGEIKHVKLEATKEVCVIAPYTLKVEITKEVIVNDDFDFVAKNIAKLVQSVGMHPQRLLMGALLDNIELFDGKPIFSTEAANLFNGSELDAKKLAEMSGTLEDMTTDNDEPLELVAETLLSSNTEAKRLKGIIASEKINEVPNEAYEAFNNVVGTARLKGKDKVFAFAGGGHTSIIEGYLADEDGVQMEQLPTTKLEGAAWQLWTYSAIYIADRKGLQCFEKTAPQG
ncbi:Clp protease ClpP [Vibrio aquimaris]|uniref:ATP-dependent Clp protease proteolytic subunit n=1 Tax=Vibrio aquimaris TaxID=2587862 RepID=A0A5P9CSA6_9VIBR|nr:Clp protease ClpP [Vibrio aquimaris]QFT28841.1 ATP-dependent Clp protease proteolytic subunit [Vibrio aquimaris]